MSKTSITQNNALQSSIKYIANINESLKMVFNSAEK
jgi:hypothetical protein